MNYYFYRLASPRPSFPDDMSLDEAQLMRAHVAYWSDHMLRGAVIAFGPVEDPAGTYGMAILRVEDGADPRALASDDPAIRADAGFDFELHPMPRLMVAPGL